MGNIFCFMTCTAVKFDESGDYDEAHGWVDYRNKRVLFENRNDVAPLINLSVEDLDLMNEVDDVIGDGIGWENNGDGMFYAIDSEEPFDDEWSYHYAVHFSHKFHDGSGWVEKGWDPMEFRAQHRPCEDCGTWLQTTLKGVVCFECAEDYYEPGEAVELVIDTARHVGVYPSQANLQDAELEDEETVDESEVTCDDPNQLSLL